MESSAPAVPSESKWLRLLYMILFLVFYRVAEVVLWAVTVFQVLASLLFGEPHPRAKLLGASLANYVSECWRYLTYNSEVKPFPFAEWPSGGNDDDAKTDAQQEAPH